MIVTIFSQALFGIVETKNHRIAMRYYKKFIEQKPESSHTPFVENRLFKLKNSRPKERRSSLVTNPMNA